VTLSGNGDAVLCRGLLENIFCNGAEILVNKDKFT
jgi:hypothetical protein